MLTTRKIAAFPALLAGTYVTAVRPRILHWGATDEESRAPYPGADLIRGGTRGGTMATTIDAPPSDVWPWLVQMGSNRAGWYSWDHLDNWGHPSDTRIHPEWQSIRLHDRLGTMPDGGLGWEVAALEPERFLGLRMSVDLRGRQFDPAGKWPRFYTDSLWGFLLNELPGGRTRLVISGYWTFEPRWLQPLMTVLFLDLQHWIMQMRQFRNLKRRVEHARPTTQITVLHPEPIAADAAAY
jgi:proline iminopeptidase